MKTGTKRFRKTVVARALITAFCGTASMMVAQETLAQASSSLERVEITGSSIRRTDAETALPVQVISREEIQRTGAASTEELLSNISAVSSSGSSNSSTGVFRSTYGFAGVSLRGLGEQRTLILVNGRRLAPFAGDGSAVNVNAIPIAAIERIEVLKDGASSLYGSDAMAGVVNFILRKSLDGVEVSAGYGSPTASGGGQNTNASVTAGVNGGDKWNAVFSGSYEKDKPMFGRERSYARTSVVPPFLNRPATGQGNIEGAVIPGAYPNDRVPGLFGNSPGSGFGNPRAADGTCGVIRMFDAGTTTRGQPYCQYDSAADTGLLVGRELWTLSANGGFKLTPQTELFGDAIYSRSKVAATYQPSPLRRSFTVPSNTRVIEEGVDPSLIVYPTNPNYPTAYLTQYAPALLGHPIAVTARVFDFGPRQQVDVSEQTRLVAGVRGNVGSQEYEVAASTNESKIKGMITSGMFSVTDYNRIINSSPDWNPWAPGGVQTGALADQLKAAQYIGPSLNASMKTNVIDGVLRGDLMKLGGNTVQYAAGAQLRREHLVSNPSAALESGDIAGLGGATPPLDRSRNITSAFGELNVPITRQIEVNGSARFDRYNDVGNTTNYKANVRWQPSSMVLLRASAGTGFRAPTLYDLWDPQVTGSSAQFCDPATGECGLQANQTFGGNPDLKPEKSKQLSAGFVLSPTSNFSFGADVFHYSIKDILATPSAQEVVSGYRAGDPTYANLVTVSGGDIDLIKTVISNLGTAKVTGVDLFANWRQNVGPGRFDLALNGTYMSKFDQTSPGGVVSHKVGTVVNPDGSPVISSNGQDGEGVVLRWKHALTGAYTWNTWTVALTQRYTSRYRGGDADDTGEPVFVPAQAFYDLNLTYRGIKNLTLSAGAKNIFDKQPAMYVPVSNQFQQGYDVSQYDPRGRFIYAKVTYLFR